MDDEDGASAGARAAARYHASKRRRSYGRGPGARRQNSEESSSDSEHSPIARDFNFLSIEETEDDSSILAPTRIADDPELLLDDTIARGAIDIESGKDAKEEKTDDDDEPISDEALITDIYRIDGSYSPGSRKLVYEDYNPLLGPPSREMTSIPKMYHSWVLLLVREFNEEALLRKTFLRINSSLILQALKSAIKSKRASFERSEFPWPNEDIFRSRESIRQAAKDISELATQHVDVLLRLVEAEYADILQDIRNMIPKGIITYGILREIFWPGDIVISFESSEPRAYRVLSCQYKAAEFMFPAHLKIKVEYVDFDGTSLGTVKRSLKIDEFEDVFYLKDLSVCPLQYISNKEAVLETLKDRGRQFLNLRGQQFKFYDGLVSSLSRRDEAYVRSRVMVDALMLKEFDSSYNVKVTPLEYETEESKTFTESLLLCTNQVPIFSFKDKTCYWGNLNQVSEITFNDKAFDQLILPPAQKDLVRAFTNSYSAGDAFDDFIAGKGKGLVFLLHGPPGVGKTMTAEAISDLLRRPLYTVTSGELGTSPSEMEHKLQRALDRASYLSAVLLLDEADVFLEQRNSLDLTRNALVSTFLRLLEYYKGVMFLTTNRLKSFDAAVNSRIHIQLQMKELTAESREAVWRNLGKLNNVELDYTLLAQKKLNGRQIKNAFRSGVILARDRGVKLSTGHVETVFTAMFSEENV